MGAPDARRRPAWQPDDATDIPTTIETSPDGSRGVSEPTGVVRCQCDRCVRWPLSEAPATSRRWLAHEPPRRPLDVIVDVPASWSECVDVGLDPRSGQPVDDAA